MLGETDFSAQSMAPSGWRLRVGAWARDSLACSLWRRLRARRPRGPRPRRTRHRFPDCTYRERASSAVRAIASRCEASTDPAPNTPAFEGFGIFDGPSDDASVRAIAAWHINFVRLLLNEDCWLAINGIKPAFSGQRYRQAIVNYVGLLHRHGIYAELSLRVGGAGHMRATSQPRAPDEDHSPAMWKSLATTFKHDSGVLLGPWGEPVVTPACLLRGGSPCPRPNGTASLRYRTAGMQQAVNVMRSAAVPRADRDPRHQLRQRPLALARVRAA